MDELQPYIALWDLARTKELASAAAR
jgi:hypothetical protein